jgi:hypothetical protein
VRTKTRNKFRAKSQRIDGIYFPSTGEANRYLELKLQEKAGVITELKIHPRYPIVINGIKVCSVVLDFEYFLGKTRTYEDWKGYYTAESKLRHKLLEAAYMIKVLITGRAK